MRDLFAHFYSNSREIVTRVNSTSKYHLWGGLKTHDDITLCLFAPRDLNPLCSAEPKDATFLQQMRYVRSESDDARCDETRRTVQNYPPITCAVQLLNTHF